jgi:hypothetical protein
VQVHHFKPEAEDPLHESHRAAWSGNWARTVVMPGPTITVQSSNAARSVSPAELDVQVAEVEASLAVLKALLDEDEVPGEEA